MSEQARSYWHPVCAASELAGQPLGVTLLGEALVVFRDEAGDPVCLDDRCAHRGAALSLGRVIGGAVTCAYHGWQYDSSGQCVRIPQFRADEPISSRARVTRYQAAERYGLIWVLLAAESDAGIPALPEWDDPAYEKVVCRPYQWQASPPRMMENFTDFGHFATVHAGILGNPLDSILAPYDVSAGDDVLRYTMTLPMPRRSQQQTLALARAAMTGIDAGDLLDFGAVEMIDLEFRYELTLPYTVVVRRVSADKLARITYFAVQPVSENACRGYVVLCVPPSEAAGRPWDDYAAGLVEIQDVVQEQDRRVVESQRPEQLPADLSAELHFRFDRLAVRYRQGLARLGIT